MIAEHVFVTGGAGFVGVPLVRELLRSGRTVTVYDCFHFGMHPLSEMAENPRLRLIKGDIQRFDARHLDGVDAILHLAALSNDPSGDLRLGWVEAVNTVATRHLAEAAKLRGISKFVFASSCAIYGCCASDELDEQSGGVPLSAYARSKLEAEQELVKLTGDGFAPIRLRSATVFGVSPRMRFDLVVNTMTLKAVTDGLIRVMGGGLQWRPLIHVQDLVKAYLLCLGPQGEALEGHAFNVVGSNIQMGELGLTIQRCVGQSDLELVPDAADPRSYRVSGARFAEATGFAPDWSLEQGIDGDSGRCAERHLRRRRELTLPYGAAAQGGDRDACHRRRRAGDGRIFALLPAVAGTGGGGRGARTRYAPAGSPPGRRCSGWRTSFASIWA